MNRDKFLTRIIFIRSPEQVKLARSILDNLPVNEEFPIQVKFSEPDKQRVLSQQQLMFAGPLKDISEQVWTEGRRYSADVWHEYFKELFLPEEFEESITLAGYVKWEILPNGRRALIGSTQQLTTKGFGQYLDEIYAYGASEWGVKFNIKGEKNEI